MHRASSRWGPIAHSRNGESKYSYSGMVLYKHHTEVDAELDATIEA